MNTEKRYYIVDLSGNFYKLNEKNDLVVAANSADAALFSVREANSRIGNGRKSHFYKMLKAEEKQPAVTAPVSKDGYESCKLSEFRTPTMYDGLHNDWEQRLSDLCYMSDHMTEYQNNLSQMLSTVDLEICDLMHYLEFNEFDDDEMLIVGKMLQARRRYRREIKDEMDKTALMKSTFLDGNFKIKVQHSLEQMEHMKDRKYTPRKLGELFQPQRETA